MKRVRILMAALCCMWFACLLAADCTPISNTYISSSATDLDGLSTDNSTVWGYDATYHCAKATAYNKGLSPSEVHLLTPALDMSNSQSVTLSFDHTHKFCGTPSDELTLWVTADYQGSVTGSAWQQLTINPYATNNDFYFVSVSVSVPTEYVGANTVFAFRYKWTASNAGTWEIKNLNIVSTCAGGGIAPIIDLPDVGNGRIRILGNNLENYYYNYAESSRPDYNTDAGRAEKTRKIVSMMLQANADIYAFCEVEAKPIVLQQLVDSLNKTAGVTYYATVSDGIDVTTDSYDNALKSGFIYRTDKVAPYGSNYAATNVTYYKNVMRIQAFEDLESHERFTISMNHFKAKSDAKSVAQRVDNANWLVSGLNNSSKVKDPDILILGDLNCGMSEEAITIIQNAGFTEQLLRFTSTAYSYCYQGSEELIDHVFANTTMAGHITGAGVWHYNTTCDGPKSSNYRYSDHDPYIVALFPQESTAVDNTSSDEPKVQKLIENGHIYLLMPDGSMYNIMGQKIQ